MDVADWENRFERCSLDVAGNWETRLALEVVGVWKNRIDGCRWWVGEWVGRRSDRQNLPKTGARVHADVLFPGKVIGEMFPRETSREILIVPGSRRCRASE